MRFSSVLSLSQHVLYESWQTYLDILYLTDGDGTVHRLASAWCLVEMPTEYPAMYISILPVSQTEICMSPRYTLKTLPKIYPVQVFVFTPLSLLNVMSIVSVTVLLHRIQSSGKHVETCNVCIAVQMLYRYYRHVTCLLHNEHPYITV